MRAIIERWLLLAVMLALPATVLHAARPTEPNASGATSLVGQLLIASPELRQPALDHAVILLAKHTRDGAFGIVINRPGKMLPYHLRVMRGEGESDVPSWWFVVSVWIWCPQLTCFASCRSAADRYDPSRHVRASMVAKSARGPGVRRVSRYLSSLPLAALAARVHTTC